MFACFVDLKRKCSRESVFRRKTRNFWSKLMFFLVEVQALKYGDYSSKITRTCFCVVYLKNAQVCWNKALKNKLHELCRQYVFEGGSPFHSKTLPMINVFPTKNQQIMMFWVRSAQFTFGLLMKPFDKPDLS